MVDAVTKLARRLFFASLKRACCILTYYGVQSSCRLKHGLIFKLCHKWLNRCSQRRSYTLSGLSQAYVDHGIPKMTVHAGCRLSRPFLRTCVWVHNIPPATLKSPVRRSRTRGSVGGRGSNRRSYLDGDKMSHLPSSFNLNDVIAKI